MELLEPSTLQTKYPQFVSFLRHYGNNEDFGTNEQLENKLDWFLANRRLFVITHRTQILGICAFIIIDSPSQLYTGQWPIDNPDGKYLYIPYITLHPNIRAMGTMKEMLNWAIAHFNNLEYIVYRRDMKTKLFKIDYLLKRRF